jgi:hypothetical protein
MTVEVGGSMLVALATVEEPTDATLSGVERVQLLICHATTATSTGTNNKAAAVAPTTTRRAVLRAASVRSATASSASATASSACRPFNRYQARRAGAIGTR